MVVHWSVYVLIVTRPFMRGSLPNISVILMDSMFLGTQPRLYTKNSYLRLKTSNYRRVVLILFGVSSVIKP